MRYELTDHEWFAIEPLLPNKSRGVPRVDDRRVLQRNLLGLTLGPTLAGGELASGAES
jgi:hypothetical protein